MLYLTDTIVEPLTYNLTHVNSDLTKFTHSFKTETIYTWYCRDGFNVLPNGKFQRDFDESLDKCMLNGLIYNLDSRNIKIEIGVGVRMYNGFDAMFYKFILETTNYLVPINAAMTFDCRMDSCVMIPYLDAVYLKMEVNDLEFHNENELKFESFGFNITEKNPQN